MEMLFERIHGGPPQAETIGAVSTSVLAYNPKRRYAVFINDSDEKIYLALHDTAEVGKGIMLSPAGGSYEINYMNYYVGQVTAICSSGGKNLCYLEG